MTDLAPVPGYLLALTGPSGVGKSTISRLLLSLSPELFVQAPILTTRGPKPGDAGEYAHVSAAEFRALRESGALAASTMIPSRSEERWYGYREADIRALWARGRVPVVITEMHLLQGLSDRFGRRSILSFGLLPPGRSRRTMLSHLLYRLRMRGRETEEQIQDRLRNAVDDLRFLRQRTDLFDALVVNDDPDDAVGRLRGLLRGRVAF